MGRVGSEYFHWIGLSVRWVGVDIAAKLAGQILHAGKDSAGDHVALDLGKPDLDLIQPPRIRRREVEMYVRMRRHKIANHLTLVRRQIVQNDVDLPRWCPFDHLFEELHKLL